MQTGHQGPWAPAVRCWVTWAVPSTSLGLSGYLHLEGPAQMTALNEKSQKQEFDNMEIPQKIKNRVAIQPSNPTSGYLSEENKILIKKHICTPVFPAALLTTAKVREQPGCPPTDHRIKMWPTDTVGYSSAIKKNEILPFATIRMNLEGIMISEISQERKKTTIPLICGI